MSSSSLKEKAKEALKNMWGLAILVTLIAGILGVETFTSGGFEIKYSNNQLVVDSTVFDLSDGLFQTNLSGLVTGFFSSFIVLVVIFTIFTFIISEMIQFGHIRFYLKLHRKQNVEISDLFEYKNYVWKALGLKIVRGFFIFLWTLLFIIPGIIAGFRYAMASYILAENPELGIMEAMDRSKEMMNGYKFDLFILKLSFIGWAILSMFTLGIAGIFVNPYYVATETAFYLDIKGEYTLNSEGESRSSNNSEIYGGYYADKFYQSEEDKDKE